MKLPINSITNINPYRRIKLQNFYLKRIVDSALKRAFKNIKSEEITKMDKNSGTLGRYIDIKC